MEAKEKNQLSSRTSQLLKWKSPSRKSSIHDKLICVSVQIPNPINRLFATVFTLKLGFLLLFILAQTKVYSKISDKMKKKNNYLTWKLRSREVDLFFFSFSLLLCFVTPKFVFSSTFLLNIYLIFFSLFSTSIQMTQTQLMKIH